MQRRRGTSKVVPWVGTGQPAQVRLLVGRAEEVSGPEGDRGTPAQRIYDGAVAGRYP
jgi:hypothetical protein